MYIEKDKNNQLSLDDKNDFLEQYSNLYNDLLDFFKSSGYDFEDYFNGVKLKKSTPESKARIDKVYERWLKSQQNTNENEQPSEEPFIEEVEEESEEPVQEEGDGDE